MFIIEGCISVNIIDIERIQMHMGGMTANVFM